MTSPVQRRKQIFNQRVFLITRFNVRNSDWRERGYIVGAEDSDWMSDRWKLFEKYCLPSVVSQTRIPDQWLIYFDETTGDRYRQKITGLTLNYPWINPQYVPDTEAFDRRIAAHVFANQSGEQCITMRLDNDDILHPQAVADIAQAASSNGDAAYCLTKGLCYAMPPLLPVLTEYNYPLSPFLAFAETPSDLVSLRTVFSIQHNEEPAGLSRLSISNAPRWIQLIHTHNLSNSVRGRVVFKREVLSEFNIRALSRPPLTGQLRFASRCSFRSASRFLKRLVRTFENS